MKQFPFQGPPLPLNPKHLWSTLSEREKQIALLSAQGKRTHAIAQELELSPKTVDTYFKHIFSKLDIHSRVELANVVRALQECGFAFGAGTFLGMWHGHLSYGGMT